jgi:hypothetical protein
MEKRETFFVFCLFHNLSRSFATSILEQLGVGTGRLPAKKPELPTLTAFSERA